MAVRMLDSTKQNLIKKLLSPSARSDVPPFMVMDVMVPEALLAAHRKQRLDGVLVASPANPTGTMMTGEALRALIAAAESEGIRFISDEIYHGLDYAFPAVTAASLSPNALIINSFSKYFCMTGWRVGWMVAPQTLVRPIERLQQNLAISVPTLSQVAAE